MSGRLARLPLIVLLMGAGALAMLVPAAHAFGRVDHQTSRQFLYAAILFGIVTALIAIASAGREPRDLARRQLLTLVGAFSLLPLMLAVPFHSAQAGVGFFDSWFEMVSSLTTTGATIYDRPALLNPSLHLWRAEVGWLGGFLMWVAALAVFMPLTIGGFEVLSAEKGSLSAVTASATSQGSSARVIHFAARLAPLYVALTGALWLLLILAGDTPLVALCHAMSTLATSGISPIGGLQYDQAGRTGEIAILIFLMFALSRATFSRGLSLDLHRGFWADEEFRLGLAIIGAVALFLFARHFLTNFDATATEAARAIWGGVFTVASFLTTTGFESVDWINTSTWAGLKAPGLVLIGLSIIGGGVATTAGGVKLLRIYALARHGQAELDFLAYPSIVSGSGADARRIRRQGAFVAWVFFMLFALSICAIMLALTLTGLQFETAAVLASAALSNTGPLAEVAGEIPVLYDGLPDIAKLILAGAMILGRLEMLVIISLMNPDFWRS